MPSSELIKILRTGAQGLDFSVRFLILDACDRLERQIKDNELLMNKIVELRTSTAKSNADRCVCCGAIIPEGQMVCPNRLVTVKER